MILGDRLWAILGERRVTERMRSGVRLRRRTDRIDSGAHLPERWRPLQSG